MILGFAKVMKIGRKVIKQIHLQAKVFYLVPQLHIQRQLHMVTYQIQIFLLL